MTPVNASLCRSLQTDEQVYHYTKQLIEQLADRVIKESENKANSSVTNDQFAEMLKKNLPLKPSNEIAELTDAADNEQPQNERISLAKLFAVVSEQRIDR
jgi:Ca2+-binding EF-hand superfamily protein